MGKIQTTEDYLKGGGKVKQCPPDTKTKREDIKESNLREYYVKSLFSGARERNKKFYPNESKYAIKGVRHTAYTGFNIPIEWIREILTKGVCEKTGIKFDFSSPKKGRSTNPFAPSMDRIDSSKEYSYGNCQIVIWMYNRAKGDGTDEEVLYLAEKLVAYNRLHGLIPKERDKQNTGEFET